MKPMDENTASLALSACIELKGFVSRAWELHAEHPELVCAELVARATCLSEATDDSAAAAIELAEHVWLSHLHDGPGLSGFLQGLSALAPASQAHGAWWRATWAAEQLEPPIAANPPASEATQVAQPEALQDAPRWRALQNVWCAMAANGHAEQATTALIALQPRAMAHPQATATRALAASCNNLATHLRMAKPAPRAGTEISHLMLQAASAARTLWAAVGTWVHVERADYQLARCHAMLGQGQAALAHAQACWAALQTHAEEPQADAFERCYAHEALAYAHAVAGNGPCAMAQREQMKQALDQVDDAQLQAWAQQAFDGLSQHLAALAAALNQSPAPGLA